jgi:hypothetical protein
MTGSAIPTSDRRSIRSAWDLSLVTQPATLRCALPSHGREENPVVSQADGRSISDWALRAIERELELAEAQLSRKARPRG